MDKDKLKNEKYDDYKNYINKLENEYEKTFKKIEVYINWSSKLNSSEKNNCFLEILDTFLVGQEEGKSVKEITGSDLKKYCDDMIYGETIYIYKASRIFSVLIGALIYVSYMQIFIRVCKAISSKDSSFIFQPMNFGIGDIALILGYTCIPKLISLITRNYFENPIRCKKVKRYTYYAVWLFTIAIYTFAKEMFEKYGIVIPFFKVVLIFIYLALIRFVIWLLIDAFDEWTSEDKRTEKEHRYFERLDKEYDIHIKKCETNSKKPLEWNKFIRKKGKINSLFITVFSAYSIIFLVFAIIIGRGMLVKSTGNINVVGVLILVGISFLDVVIVLVVWEGIRRNKQLAQIKS